MPIYEVSLHENWFSRCIKVRLWGLCVRMLLFHHYNCIIIARVIKTYTHHNTITSENAPLTNPPSLIAKSRNFHKLIVGSLNVLRISSALMELAVTLLLVLMGEVDDDILERWCMMVTILWWCRWCMEMTSVFKANRFFLTIQYSFEIELDVYWCFNFCLFSKYYSTL